ncbi:Ku protein [Burkholderia sp. 22PA0106]|uniref:non-homologous end joining protein Ku n=1 Tax=Burkholderia sp. 22PA0106 TaxID=3237371 RepID=UPI0039C1E384
MPAMIWKGAVSFGLVHVPVQLVPATRTVKPSFHLLDQRSMDPVGYRRVNKRTGREVPREDIVRGYEYEKERYVVLSDDEIRAANPESTRSIDIVTFVEAAAVSFLYLDTPYYLLPDRNGEKVYALLREALVDTGKIGIAHVVIHERQHLAALIPVGAVLALDLLRWDNELRPLDEFAAGRASARKAGVSARERQMAGKLIDDMSGDWSPDAYRDTFRDDILALVERKIKAGKSKKVETPAAGKPRAPSNVLDLTELLRRSLSGKRGRQANGGARPEAAASDGGGGRNNRDNHDKPVRKKAAAKAAKAAGKAAPAGKRAPKESTSASTKKKPPGKTATKQAAAKRPAAKKTAAAKPKAAAAARGNAPKRRAA